MDESAERADGTIFTDHQARAALVRKGFANPELEWMRCSVADVPTVLTELRAGKPLTGTHHETFPLRREQDPEAVNKTASYLNSIWKGEQNAVPRFLWNAKMRFGKTFTAYQLAKRLGAKRLFVLTFKPAVEDAWQSTMWKIPEHSVMGLDPEANRREGHTVTESGLVVVHALSPGVKVQDATRRPVTSDLNKLRHSVRTA